MKRKVKKQSKICSCCGGRVKQEIAEKQYKELDLTEGAMCEECIRENVRRIIEQIGIREKLGREEKEEWDNSELSEKLSFVLKGIAEDWIAGGTIGQLETLQRGALLLRESK